MRFLLSLVGNAIALWVAALIVPGIALWETGAPHTPGGGAMGEQSTVPTLTALLVVAVVFTLVNAVVKPIVRLLSLPLTVLTLGLFLLVVNAMMLLLTSSITSALEPLGVQYAVSGFWPALWGGIVVGLVNWALGVLLTDVASGR